MEADARPSSEGSKRKRRLPKGMSDYQAAWITEEELGDLEESGSEGEKGDEELHERQGGDAQPVLGDLAMDGIANTAELEEDDDQTDDMQVSNSRAETMKRDTVFLEHKDNEY